ncbi:MAG TPA: ribonuclease E/G, partial [Allosphingosinicella sp.]|nr:ribonuclease E/G [Allosphingosinicella sp.]
GAEAAAEPEPRKGRRRPRARRTAEAEAVIEVMAAAEAQPVDAGVPDEAPPVALPAKPRRGRRKKETVAEQAVPEDSGARESDLVAEAPQAANDESESEAKPAPTKGRAAAAPQSETVAVLEAREEPRNPDESDDGDASSDSGSPRRGWWQRTFGA